MMSIGVAEGALVLLVLDRFVSTVRSMSKNGSYGTNGATNAKLDRLIFQSERQIELLDKITQRRCPIREEEYR